MNSSKPTVTGAIEVIAPAASVTKRPTPIQLAPVVAEAEAESQINLRRLLRRYIWLAILMMIVGGALGFASVVYSTPMFRSRLLLEVQPLQGNKANNGEDANLQTQIMMIRSGGFLRRVMERLQVETLPVAPIRNDIFAKLRSRFRPETRNSTQIMSEGIEAAAASLSVRPINGTNLLEISCESIHPEVAASFVNTVGSEFIGQNLQMRTIESQRANQFLSAQVEETRSKLQEAEQRLREFVRGSGNLFAAAETTLADTTLRHFQAELASVKSERIAKQTQYEMLSKATPESVGNLVKDAAVQTQNSKLAELKQLRTQLLLKFTPSHYKVQQLDVQIAEVEKYLNSEIAKAVERTRSDYEAARKREQMLGGAHAGAAGQVSSQANQAAEYSALRREVETLQQTYSQILLQASQTSINNSLPQNNMNVVDAAIASQEPYKPKPSNNILMGCALGLAASIGIVFLRERMDRTVKAPGLAREMLGLPELGTVPSIEASEPKGGKFRIRITAGRNFLVRWLHRLPGVKVALPGGNRELMSWQERSYFAENFRHILASLLRDSESVMAPQVVLVTSPNPGEGKSTISGNLAIALAETGRKVLVIDADFRRPRLHQLFELPNKVGLANLLSSQEEITREYVDSHVVSSRYENLDVLLNGPELADLLRLLYSARLTQIMQTLREKYDVILVDAPPVLQIADTRAMDRLVDGVLLVLRSEHTDTKSLLEAYRCLREDGAYIIGTVLNDWQPQRKRVDKYYNYIRDESVPGSPRGLAQLARSGKSRNYRNYSSRTAAKAAGDSEAEAVLGEEKAGAE